MSNKTKQFLDVMIYIIPILITFIIPITVMKTIVPYYFRPDRFGHIPWYEPSSYYLLFIYYIGIIILIYINTYIFCGLRSLSKCKKINHIENAKNSLQIILWVIIGIFLINTLFLPYVKSILLQSIRIPYSLQIVDGLLLSIVVMLGASISGFKTINNVCYI